MRFMQITWNHTPSFRRTLLNPTTWFDKFEALALTWTAKLWSSQHRRYLSRVHSLFLGWINDNIAQSIPARKLPRLECLSLESTPEFPLDIILRFFGQNLTGCILGPTLYNPKLTHAGD
jgi:hypothetical protein